MIDKRNKIISENVIRLMGIRGLGVNELSRACEETSPATISKFRSIPDEANPKASTIRDLTQTMKVPNWSLLVENFPFEVVNSKPLEKISKEGYVLLCAFEKCNDEAKIAILDQVEFLIKKYSDNKASATFVSNARANYSAEKKTLLIETDTPLLT